MRSTRAGCYHCSETRSKLRPGKPANYVWPETGGRQSFSSSFSSSNPCFFEDEDEKKNEEEAKTRVFRLKFDDKRGGKGRHFRLLINLTFMLSVSYSVRR